MDITFTFSPLSRFSSAPRERQLKKAIKILGYLKKYYKKGYVIDPRPCNVNVKYTEIIPEFGNQYDNPVEEIDPKLPKSRIKELDITIFVDSNHGHGCMTGKSITGIIIFIGRTPIHYYSKRQSLVQTSTFGAEFIAIKSAVEEAITIRYYLISMGVKVEKATVIYSDNLNAIRNTMNPESPLKKKYLALAYHFFREHYNAGVVKIWKIDTDDNFADPFTKGLVLIKFHKHFNSMMTN